MIWNWTKHAKALARELGALRTDLASSKAAFEERLAALSDDLSRLTTRVSDLENDTRSSLRALEDRARSLDEASDEHRDERRKMETGLAQVEGQMRVVSEEAHKIGTSLWERIEALQTR